MSGGCCVNKVLTDMYSCKWLLHRHVEQQLETQASGCDDCAGFTLGHMCMPMDAADDIAAS